MVWKVQSYLGDNSQVGVHGAGGVLLDPDDGETEGGLELGVRHVRLVHPQPHGPDEPLELGRLPREVVAHKRHLGHHPLPALPLRFARLEHFKHLRLGLLSVKELSFKIILAP